MNLNMQAFNINTLLGGLDKVRDVMGVYQQQLLLIVIVFALLNCFFGYALRKLWSVIPGFFLGAAAGFLCGALMTYFSTFESIGMYGTIGALVIAIFLPRLSEKRVKRSVQKGRIAMMISLAVWIAATALIMIAKGVPFVE